MTRRERLHLFLLWISLGLLPLFMRPLWEPDEARYAEIPREMLAAGDWLTPRLNGVLYFEKPPLQYWLSALSMRLFGLHPWAARLPLALASAILLWCAWRLARRLGASQPLWTAFMAGTALLAFVCGQILTLDALFAAFLLLSLTAVLEAVSARFELKPARAWTLLAFVALALATLTKGIAAPVLVGGIFLLSLPWVWKTRELRCAWTRTFFDPLGWALLLLLVLPWFVAVDRAHPGHARFFFIHEHFARFATHVHAREGSKNPFLDKLYFVGILGAGLLPWLQASLRGLARSLRFLKKQAGPRSEGAPLHRWTVAALLLAAGWPLAFFSLSGSKLPPYILPSVLPLLVLACAFEGEEEGWRSLKRTGWELCLFGLLLLLASPLLKIPQGSLGWILAVGAACALTGLWALRPKGLTGPRFMAALAATLLLVVVAAQRVAGTDKDISPLVRQAPSDAQWICHGNYFQALPFLTGRRVAVVAGTGELAYGRDHLEPSERERWFQEDPKALTPVALRLRAEDPARPVWALTELGSWRELPEDQKAAWALEGRRAKLLLLRLKP